jgi:hypothetical protein
MLIVYPFSLPYPSAYNTGNALVINSTQNNRRKKHAAHLAERITEYQHDSNHTCL